MHKEKKIFIFTIVNTNDLGTIVKLDMVVTTMMLDVGELDVVVTPCNRQDVITGMINLWFDQPFE